MIGPLIVNQDKVVHPSQLIASVNDFCRKSIDSSEI
jgi:hypothetical protein